MSQELNNNHDSLKENEQVLDLLRILAYPEIERRLAHVFTSSKEMLVYELTDGERSTRDIELSCGVSKDAVSDMWKKWGNDGLAQSTGPKRPYKAKYSLAKLALLQLPGKKEKK
jgi:hypothetical protein